MQLAYNQLVDRLDRAKIDLPEEVRDHTFVWKWNPDTDMEVMWVGVALPDGVARGGPAAGDAVEKLYVYL